MILKDFAKISQTKIEVKSARSGKILCRHYIEKMHPTLADREVVWVWVEIRTSGGAFSNIALPVLCAYVSDYVPEQEAQG